MDYNKALPIYIIIWTEGLIPILPYFELMESAEDIAFDPDYTEET